MQVSFRTGTFNVRPKFETEMFAIVGNKHLGKVSRKFSIFFKPNTSAPLIVFIDSLEEGQKIIQYFEKNLEGDYSLQNLKKVHDQYFKSIRN